MEQNVLNQSPSEMIIGTVTVKTVEGSAQLNFQDLHETSTCAIFGDFDSTRVGVAQGNEHSTIPSLSLGTPLIDQETRGLARGTSWGTLKKLMDPQNVIPRQVKP